MNRVTSVHSQLSRTKPCGALAIRVLFNSKNGPCSHFFFFWLGNFLYGLVGHIISSADEPSLWVDSDSNCRFSCIFNQQAGERPNAGPVLYCLLFMSQSRVGRFQKHISVGWGSPTPVLEIY